MQWRDEDTLRDIVTACERIITFTQGMAEVVDNLSVNQVLTVVSV